MIFMMNPIFFLLLQILASTVVLHAAAFPGHHNTTRHSLNTDKATLMLFKIGIKFDPNSTLSNWEERFDVCNFTGVECDKHHRRVVSLSLIRKGLVGKLTPYIANLTGLRTLDLYENIFNGTIPSEFSSLRHLRLLRLQKNRLHGLIPESFSLLSNLTVIRLNHNRLTGSLPSSFFSNCTLLANVDLSNNFLIGKIPEEIGNCPKLWNLNLYNNQFTGQLPRSLVNISLWNINVNYNNLWGQLPTNIVEHLPKLRYLDLSYNNMVSHDNNTNLEPFFAALGNCTILAELELAGMGLGGKLPPSISKLTNLTTLRLQENRIFGSFPSYAANLSGLNVLNLTSNFLNGTISSNISRLLNLEQLFLSHNLFNTKVPEGLGKLPRLGLLDLSNNEFFGSIPESIGNLGARARLIFLNNNHLSGSIPTTLGKWTDLQKLDVSYNRLTGIVPKEILGLRGIQIFLNLSHNQLEGSLPMDLNMFSKVQEIDLSSNRFNGTIFPQISSCVALKAINLSNNFLQGHIPDSVGDLKNLESFDVSLNRLSGQIPRSLNKCSSLIFLNLSFNNFVGKVPSNGIFSSISSSSLLGNPHLCGAVLGISRCSSKKIRWFHGPAFYTIFISVILASGVLAAICCMIGFRYMRVTAAETQSIERKTPTDPTQKFPRIKHRQLFEATGGFDEQRLVGTEYGFGSNTSTKGDVYSFGIILLEMVTRKRPTDDMFASGVSLQQWVKSSYHVRVEKVIDSSLMRASRDQPPEVTRMWEVAIEELVELGILCTQESPSTRPTMVEVAYDLDRLKRYLSGDTTVTFASSLGISS